MSHNHSIYDTDKHFKINPISRGITSEASAKTVIMQYDHNSERFTFEIPRFIEGHDMLDTDFVHIHYINVSPDKTKKNDGLYKANDVQVSPDDENIVIFSWLISENATQIVGSLNFLITFVCTENNKPVYKWSSDIYTNISISAGINNDDIVYEEYSDILLEWKSEIDARMNDFKLSIIELFNCFEDEIDKRINAIEHTAEVETITTLLADVDSLKSANEENTEVIDLLDTRVYDLMNAEEKNDKTLINHEKRLTYLESVNLDYIKDSTVACEKVVPSDVGPYALIKSVCGATERITSNNVINPRDICPSYIGEGILTPIIDDDGSISFTVESKFGTGAIIEIGLPDTTAKYYYLVEGTNKEYIDVILVGTYLTIACHLPHDTELYGERGYPEKITFNLKVMIYKYEDSDTVEFTEAPEGTVFEPYFEPYFKNAEVTKVESIGSNLLPFPYYDGTKTIGEGYTIEQRGVTYTVLSDGGIKVKGTAESTQMFILARNFNFEAGKTYFKRPTSKFHISYKDENEANKWAGNSFVWKAEYKLVQIYIQIEKDTTVDEVIYPYINVGAVGEYKQYRGTIDTIDIPEAVRSLEGYGREGSYIEWVDGNATLTVTKDENLEALAEPIVTDITEHFTEDNAIEIEQGGVIRFVNEHKMAVPNTIQYVIRKG